MKHLKYLALLLFSTGLLAQSHSVTVNWTASPDAAANPTLSYNVYKANSACSSASSFTKIDSTAAGILTFTDTSVSVGQTLCYEVTAVLNGLESAPSPSVQAVILPQAPTNVTVTVK